MNLLMLRNPLCGHAIGMANLIGRNLLETKRMRLSLEGYTGWEVAEAPPDEVAEAIGMPWPPCGTCGRHDLIGQPFLFMGGPHA